MTMFLDRIQCGTAVTANMTKVNNSFDFDSFDSSKENESGACQCTNLYHIVVSRYGLQCKI